MKLQVCSSAENLPVFIPCNDVANLLIAGTYAYYNTLASFRGDCYKSAAVTRSGSPPRNMIALKINCPCGQHFIFDVEPVDDRMPCAVACPGCGVDATALANAQIQ